MAEIIQGLAGLVFYSPNPDALTAFYRKVLGIPFEDTDHGPGGLHREALVNNTHFAIWDAAKGHGVGPLVPVFRVADAEWAAEAVERAGASLTQKVIDIGEGKRIAGFVDPDGRPFRLIQL